MEFPVEMWLHIRPGDIVIWIGQDVPGPHTWIAHQDGFLRRDDRRGPSIASAEAGLPTGEFVKTFDAERHLHRSQVPYQHRFRYPNWRAQG